MRKAARGDAKKAIAYVRVSTEEQANGPEAQRSSIDSWARAHGVEVIETFTDHLSGAKPIDARPGLMAALESLRPNRAGLLVVAKRDRLARDMIVAATIERVARLRGAEVVSADGVGRGDDPASQLLRNVLDATGEYERAVIRSRTVAALAEKRHRGELSGSPPYGWRVARDKTHLELDVHEQEVMRHCRLLRQAGYAYHKIARKLAEEKLFNRVGKIFDVMQIMKILRRRPSCARGHLYMEHQIGLFCCKDLCGKGRGDAGYARLITWRIVKTADAHPRARQ